jgi:LPS export ABC transporter protein LptC
MRRLSVGILVVVAAFVGLVTSILVARSRTVEVEPPVSVTSKADYQIKEVRLEERSGSVRWRLRADQAEVYEQDGRTGLRAPVVDVYETNGSWRVSGDEGIVRQRTKDLELRKNVIVLGDEGLRLETSVLRWEAAAKRLWTDAPVTITRPGTMVRGSGIEIYFDEDRALVRGRVHASFSRRSSLPKGPAAQK